MRQEFVDDNKDMNNIGTLKDHVHGNLIHDVTVSLVDLEVFEQWRGEWRGEWIG
jgi:hypothetical protein